MGNLGGKLWTPLFISIGFVLFFLVFYLVELNLSDVGLQTITKNEIERIADLIKDEADKSGELTREKAEDLIDDQLSFRTGKTANTNRQNGSYSYEFEIIKPLDKYTYGSTGAFRLTVIQPRFSKILSSKNIKFIEERTVVNRGYFGEGYKE